jgi:alcohol dehydrogenase (cytochrome c)
MLVGCVPLCIPPRKKSLICRASRAQYRPSGCPQLRAFCVLAAIVRLAADAESPRSAVYVCLMRHQPARFGLRVRRCIAPLAGAAAALVLAGCGAPPAASVGWPNWGNSALNTHSSSLRRINTANVSSLQLVWRRSQGANLVGWETFPVVIGRTMYYTTNTDEVDAVDAVTGKLRWSYVPRVNLFAGPLSTSTPVSRGVAVGGGRVYDLTYDDQLLAMKASTGRLLWRVPVASAADGETEDSPGVYWDGEVIVGGPAGSSGQAGFVAAFDASTGRRLWRTSMVPVRSRRSADSSGQSSYGGADVWMPPVVDPASGTVYVGTGNPTPAFSGVRARGCDRWADATVALNARTGAFRWGHTEFCNDSWDYDTDQSPMIFDLRAGSQRIRVIGDGSKAGFYSVMRASTGASISRSPMLTRFSRPHKDPTRAGVDVCPGNFGGLEYGPPAYSASSGRLYVGVVDMCMRFKAARGRAAKSGLGGTAIPLGRSTGSVVALDPATGAVGWRRALPKPAPGGVLSTAGGLVFVGDDDGSLYALSAASGHVLWRRRIGLRFGSAPIAYEVDGREYLAVVAGGSQLPADGGAPAGGRIVVFALPR